MKLLTASIGATAFLAISLVPTMGRERTQNAAVPATRMTGTNVDYANGVSRTTKALNYRRAGGSVKISFRGTELMRSASGEAKVRNKNNRMEIEAKFTALDDASKFGLEYLTYVFWVISPQGRAENLGEVILKNGEAMVKADTDMQTFGMIVTAEPYFAVTQPGNM